MQEAVIEFNQSMQRISSISFSLPQMNDFMFHRAIDDNGYSTKSESISSCQVFKYSSNRNRTLIYGFIRNSNAIGLSSVLDMTVKEIHRFCRKPTKKRKRKKRNKLKRLVNIKYKYEKNIRAVSDIKHEAQIKEWLLNEKWYDMRNIKSVDIYGAADSNGRITLSLESSEFMRRCKNFMKHLNNDTIELIPVHMRNANNDLCVHYLLIVTIDSVKNIDIVISFNYRKQFGITVSGIHLDPKDIGLSRMQYDSKRFIIGYLDIYSQSKEYYEDRYNKILPFVQDFLKTDANKFRFKDWNERAQILWQNTVGTVN
eukprot:437572_1